MASASISRPDLMAVAVHRIRPALRSSLPAGGWLIIERELDSAAATLSDERRTAEHPAAALTVVRLLSTAETGRKLLAGRLAAQDAIVARVPGADRAALLGALAVVDLDASPATAADRGITLAPGGVGGGTSLKLRNFRVDFAALLKLGATSVTALQAVLAGPNPLVITAGVLTIAQALADTMTAPIGEDEASLFWSFAQTAADRDEKSATEDELRAASDRHRPEFGLEPLTPVRFTRALRKLEALSSIRPHGEGCWQLRETYRVA
ncbi:hypothetical protein [Streptomyces sp. NPDC047043]|uniref:hypothetical protein n=1 Tax=Streptomyces sp. NPDC047043 TaxID=3154497 RepID=UPI0033F4C7DB